MTHRHWILHIRVRLGTKFQFKLTTSNFWNKFAQKGYFWLKTEKVSIHSVHWFIKPPPSQKHHPRFFVKSPLWFYKLSKPHFFRQFPAIYWFFVNPPKNQIFPWTPIIFKFLILSCQAPLFENLTRKREGVEVGVAHYGITPEFIFDLV